MPASSLDQRPKAAAPEDVTDDAFLGGRVRLWQPREGFRAGLDSVVLAASVPARRGQKVCDLGAGAGVAVFCLAARVEGLRLAAVEIDPALADIAEANANRLGLALELHRADILKRPRSIPRQHFDHVLTNPPFHDAARGTRAPSPSKRRATSAGPDDLMVWFRFARSLVKPGGTLTSILPPERLPVLLAAVAPDGSGAEILALWPRAGEQAKRIVVRIRINSRTPLRLLPGIVLHDASGLTAEARAVLRDGTPLGT